MMDGGSSTYLVLGRGRGHAFDAFSPVVVSSVGSFERALDKANQRSLWFGRDRRLWNQCIRTLDAKRRRLGAAILCFPVKASQLHVAGNYFDQVVPAETRLSDEELVDVLSADERRDLFIAGSVDQDTRKVSLWRGDCSVLVVPFSIFQPSGDGVEPDFDRFAVADFGHTVRFGDYEAAADAILYECDSDYRRRLSKRRIETDQGFGPSLRRLRLQRGLSQSDFPGLDRKTIARIENGRVSRIHADTKRILASRLKVAPEDIELY